MFIVLGLIKSELIIKGEETLAKYEELLQENDIVAIRKILPKWCVEKRVTWHLLRKKVLNKISELFKEAKYFHDKEKDELIAIEDSPLLFLERGDVIICFEYFYNGNPVDEYMILAKHDEIWNGHLDEGQKMRKNMAREAIMSKRKRLFGWVKV